MKTKQVWTILLAAVLCAALLAGCGGGKEDAEKKKESEFLMGSWFARTASANGVTVDASEVFGGTFMLYFSDSGDCTMSIDQNRAIVKWELTDDGVTLTGDDSYSITFPDESRKTMVLVINGIDVFLEKYEE